MSSVLGESDTFALESIIHDRDSTGATMETLTEHVSGDAGMFVVQFMDEDAPRIVQSDVPAPGENVPDVYAIEAELTPAEDTDAASLMEHISTSLSGSGYSIVHECGSTRYYVVSVVTEAGSDE